MRSLSLIIIKPLKLIHNIQMLIQIDVDFISNEIREIVKNTGKIRIDSYCYIKAIENNP